MCVCACVRVLIMCLRAGLSCQRTCVQWQGKSMNQCPVCRQYAFPKLRSVKIQSVTLITQVPSQVCKYDVMCMELRTCHAESFAGLQIYIMCMELRAVLHRVPRTVCKHNARMHVGECHIMHVGDFLRLPCCTYCTCSPAREN